MMAQTTSTRSDQEGFQKKDGQGGLAAPRTMIRSRAVHLSNKRGLSWSVIVGQGRAS